MPRQIIIKLLKTKGKGKILKAIRKKKKADYLHGENNQKDRGCIIRNHGGQEKVALLKITERKELSTMDSISGTKKIYIQPLEIKGKSRQTYSSKMVKENSFNRKEIIMNEDFKPQKGRISEWVKIGVNTQTVTNLLWSNL